MDHTISIETLLAQSRTGLPPSGLPEGIFPLTPSIHPSTTYVRQVSDAGYAPGRLYARDENPMYDAVESLLIKLEGGNCALAFSSGMAAVTAMLQALPPNSHLVAPTTAFIGFINLLKRADARGEMRVSWYDNASKESLANAVQDDTAMIWVETPGNPTWPITDIAYASRLAKKVGAKLTVDNTIPTPVLTKPFELGADCIWHSATKYMGGHHDLVAGCVISQENDDYFKEILYLRRLHGGTLGAFDSWMLMRGLQTLYPRMQIACNSAQRIAEFLEQHPKMENVSYPGLPSHPQHNIAKQQMRGGFGAMLSCYINGGKIAALRLIQNLKIFQCATSLGGTISLIDHRKSVEGEDSPLPDNLLRLSIGTERCEDLLQDLEQALASL